MAEPLKNRLLRYTKKYLTEKTDPDFADAIFEAAEELTVQSDVIEHLRKTKAEKHNELLKVSKELKDCRNELCLRCGEYRTRHLGSCDDCRWKDGG